MAEKRVITLVILRLRVCIICVCNEAAAVDAFGDR